MIFYRKKTAAVAWVAFFLFFDVCFFCPPMVGSMARHHSMLYVRSVQVLFPAFSLWFFFYVLPLAVKTDDAGMGFINPLLNKKISFAEWGNIVSLRYSWPGVYVNLRTDDSFRPIVFDIYSFDYKKIISLILEKNSGVLVDEKLKEMCGRT
jgi:hypothetical protein